LSVITNVPDVDSGGCWEVGEGKEERTPLYFDSPLLRT
jgi:hypothetical protein